MEIQTIKKLENEDTSIPNEIKEKMGYTIYIRYKLETKS